MGDSGEDHRHCKVCGKVVGPDSEFCSKACRRDREAAQQTKRNLNYLIYAGIAFFMLLLVLTYVR